MRGLTIIVVCVVFFSLDFMVTSAQDLAINMTVTGSLEAQESASYAFIAREGQILSFVAQSESDLDVMIRIENLNGDTILENDDYNYPDSINAIIEGFVAPYTGNYTLVIMGYGDTSGDYTLDMLAGYSTLTTQTQFDTNENWQAIGLDLIDVPTLGIVNGTANLIQTGIDRIGLGIGVTLSTPIYFVRTTIDSISDTAGWRTGLVFGYQDERNFYRATVNHRGAWRVVAVRNGEETVLRDWNVHPAISVDERSFSLAVLVNDTHFDIFYNDQYVGSASDLAFEAGQVGFVAETVNAFGSEVTVRFDDLIITEPTFVNDEPIFPQSLILNGTNSTIRELQQRLLIPTNGDMAFTLSESFAQNNQQGISRFAIGDGRIATNFVVSARISWVATQADLNGCGMVVRDDGSENYVLAYLDSEGGYGLSEHASGEFIQNVYNVRDDNQRPPYNVLLIVRDDVIHYFVDNVHAFSMTIGTREGSIAEAVVNFDAVNTNCQFNTVWVWQW